MFYIPTNTVNLVLPIFLSDSLKHDEKNVCAFDFIRSHCQCCFCSPPPTILNECIEQSKWSIDDKHQQYNQMPNESSQTQIPIHTVREYTDTEIEKKETVVRLKTNSRSFPLWISVCDSCNAAFVHGKLLVHLIMDVACVAGSLTKRQSFRKWIHWNIFSAALLYKHMKSQIRMNMTIFYSELNEIIHTIVCSSSSGGETPIPKEIILMASSKVQLNYSTFYGCICFQRGFVVNFCNRTNTQFECGVQTITQEERRYSA